MLGEYFQKFNLFEKVLQFTYSIVLYYEMLQFVILFIFVPYETKPNPSLNHLFTYKMSE